MLQVVGPSCRDKCKREACAAGVCEKAMQMMGWPRAGDRWDTIDGSATCRVFGDPRSLEGYVAARFKGAAPFLLHANDWPKRFKHHNVGAERAPTAGTKLPGARCG